MNPIETEMRESILRAVKVGMGKGLRATDVVITAMTFALTCAQACVLAAINGKEDEVREKLAEAFERMAEELRRFEPPTTREEKISPWERKRHG